MNNDQSNPYYDIVPRRYTFEICYRDSTIWSCLKYGYYPRVDYIKKRITKIMMEKDKEVSFLSGVDKSMNFYNLDRKDFAIDPIA